MEIQTRAAIAKPPGSPDPEGVGYLLIKRDEGFLMVPDPIDAEITDGKWVISFQVRIDKDDPNMPPRIARLEVVRRPDGPWISPDMIRGVKLGEAIDRAVVSASLELTPEGNVHRFGPLPPASVAPAFSRHRVDVEEVQRAAAAYRQATTDRRKDRLMAVADALNVSRSTAHRRVQAAKAAGLLREATDGQR